MKQELIDFLKHIKEKHTDKHGTLQIVDDGDELDPKIENVVDDYLKLKKREIIQKIERVGYNEEKNKLWSYTS